MNSHDNSFFFFLRGVLRTVFLFSFLSSSCTTVLPHLPSSCADRRQTYPGTLHLRAVPCAASSRVSPSNCSRHPKNTGRSHLRTHFRRFRSGDTNQAPRNFLPPVGVEHPPRGCRVPLFASQDQRPRPCTYAT